MKKVEKRMTRSKAKKTVVLVSVVAMIMGLLSSIALAQSACVTAPAENQSILDLDTIAGVYKKTFENGFVGGTKYKSENILEIVKLSPVSAYFRTHLEFFNGNLCGLSGIATSEKDGLVYHGPLNKEGQECVLHLRITDGSITFDEEGACEQGTCGSRGGYNHASFDRKARRDIRYMSKLVKSPQYSEAVKNFRNHEKICSK